jgi:biotin carboxylase
VKTLLVVSGGAEAAAVTRRAKELGFYTVVCDRDPEAPAFAFADSVLIADPFEPDEAGAAAERFSRKIRRIDGALSIAADAPLTFGGLVRRLGLTGLSEESARLFSDRLAMKQRLSSAGLAVPGFAAVETPQALARIAIGQGRNFTIRPVDGRDEAGVQRLSEARNTDHAFMHARAHSPTERVMAEQELDGARLAVQSVVTNGQSAILSVANRLFDCSERFAPFRVENGRDLPSALPVSALPEIATVMAQAAAILGVTDGPLQGDIVLREGKPVLADMRWGLAGGVFCTGQIPLATGIDVIGIAVRIALGETVPPEEMNAKHARFAVCRQIFAGPGRIVSIAGVDDARKLRGIAEVRVQAKPGDIVSVPDQAPIRAATILAGADSHDAALSTVVRALELLRIETA